jgi:hypothetical protein
MTEQQFFDEINLAREFMGSKKTTSPQWDAIIKRLGMLTIGPEAPERLRYIAEGQLFEATRRRIFVDTRGLNDGKD